ncbi:MAG: site-2 protease family protein, partial [Planctomycetales bacterium]|nr:site-2 protease family protein [Planctomycetales bacterium]
AWQANIQPGFQVLRVGESGEPKEEYRFDKDMAQRIAMHGGKSDVVLLGRDHAGQTPYTLRLRPRKIQTPMGSFATIGVTSSVSVQLADEDPLPKGLPAASATVPLQGGDLIVGAAAGGESIDIQDFPTLQAFLARHVDEPVMLRMERTKTSDEGTKSTTKFETNIATRPLKTLGVALTMGPITAIQAQSPATHAKALSGAADEDGLRVGDVIQSVDDQPVEDPMLLPMVLGRRAGEKIRLTVLRPGEAGKSRDVQLEIEPRVVNDYQHATSPDEPVLVDALGVTYSVDLTVAHVAAQSGAGDKLQPGDKIVKLQLAPAGKDEAERKATAEKLKEDYGGKTFDEIDLTSDKYTWAYPTDAIQSLGDQVEVKLTFLRDGKESTVVATPYDHETFHYPSRGMKLKALAPVHVADNWSEAFSLGLRETKESLWMVVTFLKKLVTNQISATSLGGPLMILAAGASEASVGPGRLLVFLTMLSANLAVVNFLPIPVLDGGHMIFLLYEGIRRRPVDEKWQIRLTLIGFTFLLSLMAFVIGMDLYRFSGLAGQ